MEKLKLDLYWNDIPVGKENAVTYAELNTLWGIDERRTRAILHELSAFDNGDDYILIRSSNGKGFYKTDNEEEINAYKLECLNRGRNVFAPVKKINRVLNANKHQFAFENNIRVIREGCGMNQGEVCKKMKKYDPNFNKPMLSRIENSVFYPTPYQLFLLAQIFGCKPSELVNTDLYI